MSKSKATGLWTCLTLACVLLMRSHEALAREYDVDGSADNKVVFISHAPLDDFEGVTNKIDGYVTLNCDSLLAPDSCPGGEFYFEVDLASLDTGIGLRNRHMRENYLETEEYPYAKYKGEIVSIDGGDTYTVRTSGTMSIHGVDREMESICKVNTSASGYHVVVEFNIRLTDFNIEVPSLMFMKINEEIVVKLDFDMRAVDGQ